jgi:hypothetical protein
MVWRGGLLVPLWSEADPDNIGIKSRIARDSLKRCPTHFVKKITNFFASSQTSRAVGGVCVQCKQTFFAQNSLFSRLERQIASLM